MEKTLLFISFALLLAGCDATTKTKRMPDCILIACSESNIDRSMLGLICYDAKRIPSAEECPELAASPPPHIIAVSKDDMTRIADSLLATSSPNERFVRASIIYGKESASTAISPAAFKAFYEKNKDIFDDMDNGDAWLRRIADYATSPASGSQPPPPLTFPPLPDFSHYTTEELIRWLDYSKMPDNLKALGNDYTDVSVAICDELVKRHDIPKLLAALDSPDSGVRSVRRYLTGFILFGMHSPEITKAFEARLNEKTDEDDYYVAQYLAERGNRRALEILNRNYFQYPVSSWQWSYTAGLFGRFDYRPAIPNLVKSLNAASLNLVSGAASALRLLYPDAPEKFETLEACHTYFAEMAKKEFGATE